MRLTLESCVYSARLLHDGFGHSKMASMTDELRGSQYNVSSIIMLVVICRSVG